MNKKQNPYYIRNTEGRLVEPYRVIMEEHLGRKLETWEIVHHINGDHYDNRLENLTIMTNSEHARLHGKDKTKEIHRVKKNLSIEDEVIKKAQREANRIFGGNVSAYITYLINKDLGIL